MVQEPEQDALLGEDQPPCVDFDEIAGPHRQHHCHVEQRLGAAARVARHVVGDRPGDHSTGDGDRDRHEQRAAHDVQVGRMAEQRRVSGERGLTDDGRSELVDRIKTLQQQRDQRAQVHGAEPQQWRQQQQEQVQSRAAIEQPAEPAGIHRGSAQASGTMAARGQAIRTCAPASGGAAPRGSAAITIPSPCTCQRLVAP